MILSLLSRSLPQLPSISMWHRSVGTTLASPNQVRATLATSSQRYWKKSICRQRRSMVSWTPHKSLQTGHSKCSPGTCSSELHRPSLQNRSISTRDLPPSSRVRGVRFSEAARMMAIPTRALPVTPTAPFGWNSKARFRVRQERRPRTFAVRIAGLACQ